MNMNPNLPENAIAVTSVEEGMRIRTAFSGVEGVVASVTRYYFNGRVKVTLTDGTEIRCNEAGTFRLVS